MSKTQGELLTDVRERLDESTGHMWQDSEIRRWINQGARDIARKTETLLTTEEVAGVVGTASYVMPADIIRVHRVEWITDSEDQTFPLEYRDYNNADGVWWTQQNQTEGVPFMFTMWGFPPSLQLIIYPVPSDVGTIKIFYYRLSAELDLDGTDSGVVVEIPEGWDDVIADYAEFKALRKDRDPTWQEAKALYDEHVLDLNTTTRRWIDEAGMITTENSFVPAWLYSTDGW